MIVSIAQTQPISDQSKSVGDGCRLVIEAARKGAQAVFLPELSFIYRLPTNRREAAVLAHTNESLPFSTMALACTGKCYVGFGYVGLESGELYNAYSILDPHGKIIKTWKVADLKGLEANWCSAPVVSSENDTVIIPGLGRVGCLISGLSRKVRYQDGSVDTLLVPTRERHTDAWPPKAQYLSNLFDCNLIYANIVDPVCNGGSYVSNRMGQTQSYGSSFSSEALVGAIIETLHIRAIQKRFFRTD
jgi:hypothetical protein